MDLAKLYQVETGALNRAVKRNLKRFPEDFCFQITEEEYLICHSGISILFAVLNSDVIVFMYSNSRITNTDVAVFNTHYPRIKIRLSNGKSNNKGLKIE